MADLEVMKRKLGCFVEFRSKLVEQRSVVALAIQHRAVVGAGFVVKPVVHPDEMVPKRCDEVILVEQVGAARTEQVVVLCKEL